MHFRRVLPIVLFTVAALAIGPEGVWGQSDSTSGSDPHVEVGPDGFRMRSGDEAFELRFRGDLFADARFLPESSAPPGAEEVFLRRMRLRLQGRVYDRFTFRLRPDFGIGGPEIDDAFLEVRFAPAVHVRMGRFKVPVGLENLQSTTGLMHVERGFPNGLVPGRDIGLMVSGQVVPNRLRYALGIFNGTPGTSEPGDAPDDTKEGVARLFARPFAGQNGPLEELGVGLAGSFGEATGTDDVPSLRTLGTTGRQTFFQYRPGARADGHRWRVAPQARLYAGPVELLGEYTVAGQEVRNGPAEETLVHRAWQVSGAVVLTGEDAREGEVVPRDPFAAERGTGAIELGARVHGITLDDDTFPVFAASSTAATDARAWGLTLSWYPNTMVRMMLGYERTTFDGGGVGSDRASENLILTRIQLAF